MPQSSMGYHQAAADYGQADTRHAQGFTTGPYNPTAMMYNVQSTAGAQNPGVYDTGPPFPPRQPAALQIMETDVGGPYFPGEPTNTAAAAPAMHPQSEPSAAQAVYHQQQGLQNYSSSMASMGGLGSQATTTSASQNVSMEEEELPAISGLDEAYASYQSALREIFRNIQDGVLATAGQSLLRVSDWLLSHVVQLGLTSDDQNLHSDRIRLWNDFNHAWLGIFQRQKDMMESGQTLDRNQSLISLDELKSMGNELVRLCDGIERHGLVDYQYGVWEERIIEILGECVDLYENHDESGESVSVPSSQQ
ncbi:hypothetical protein VTK73DRAFT_8135 [Phialemonium thermophilum]|uniref:Uncharacterized protein n=1 Tax=Phialemonium thermophilum TaxID=223376 RepID=A0ABR3XQT5_9PEZI